MTRSLYIQAISWKKVWFSTNIWRRMQFSIEGSGRYGAVKTRRNRRYSAWRYLVMHGIMWHMVSFRCAWMEQLVKNNWISAFEASWNEKYAPQGPNASGSSNPTQHIIYLGYISCHCRGPQIRACRIVRSLALQLCVDPYIYHKLLCHCKKIADETGVFKMVTNYFWWRDWSVICHWRKTGMCSLRNPLIVPL